MQFMRSSKQSRILMSTDAVGGVWTYALELSRGLSRLGVDVLLVVLGPDPSPAQRQEAEAVDGLHLQTTRLPLDWTAHHESELDEVADALRSLACDYRADLAHLNAPAHAGASRWPMPLVVAMHSCVATWWRAVHGGPLPDDLAWRKQRTAAGLSVADLVIAPSGSFAREIAEMYGSGPPIEAVHNGRELASSGMSRQRDLVVVAGRLWDPAKNVGVVDRAAALGGMHIVAAGPTAGPNGACVAPKHLNLVGPLDPAQMTLLLTRAAIFVNVAKYEPFGLAALEAAQAGAALVLSDIPTHRELWSGAACFVSVDDERALVDALRKLGGDWRQCADLAARARQRARFYTSKRMVAETLRAYGLALRTGLERTDTVVAA